MADRSNSIREAPLPPLDPHPTGGVEVQEDRRADDLAERQARKVGDLPVDVLQRRQHDRVDVGVQRPVLGDLGDDAVEALAEAGVTFEQKNPVTTLMKDAATGEVREDILDEKILSAMGIS